MFGPSFVFLLSFNESFQYTLKNGDWILRVILTFLSDTFNLGWKKHKNQLLILVWSKTFGELNDQKYLYRNGERFYFLIFTNRKSKTI